MSDIFISVYTIRRASFWFQIITDLTLLLGVWYNSTQEIVIHCGVTTLFYYYLSIFFRQVRYILEGELMKRKQLQKDFVQIKEWITKSEKETKSRLNGNVDTTEKYLDVCLYLYSYIFL